MKKPKKDPRMATKPSFTFPGVVINKKAEEVKKKEAAVMVPPKMTMEPVSDEGELTFKFNQLMVFPPSLN